MKIIPLLFTLFIVAFNGYSQSTKPFVKVTDKNDKENILIDCDYDLDADKCFVLKADYTKIKETSSYKVEPVQFETLTGLNNEQIVNVSEDDYWSKVFDIPFEFCFYNKTYNKLIIGDNGIVSFNINKAQSDSKYSSAVLPNSALHPNSIFGAFHDMTNDPTVNGCTTNCGEIKTYERGTAPNRSFVISYENVNHFNCASAKSTTQIVIYETSNIVEVYIKEKPINCEDDNRLDAEGKGRKNALIGIQNSDGTNAVTPPNRNSGIWATTNEAWRFVPNGALITKVEWTDSDGNNLGVGDEKKVCPQKTTTYKAKVTYDVCVGEDVVVEDEIEVKIAKDFPIATDSEVTVCDTGVIGKETVNLTQYENLIVGTQTGLAVSYYATKANADAKTNEIINIANYELTQVQETFYVRIDRGTGGTCFDIATLIVNLKETPTFKTKTISLCDVGNDNTENITLSNYNSTITQSGVNVSYYNTESDANTKTDPITNITATDKDKIFVRLDLGNEGSCENIAEVSIELAPIPEVKRIEKTLCENQKFYNLTQHETEVITNTSNAVSTPFTINFSYYPSRTLAEQDKDPIDPSIVTAYPLNTNEIDPVTGKFKKVKQVWVRSTIGNCYQTFSINFEYEEGVQLINDNYLEVSTTNPFNLKDFESKFISNLTDITVEYYTNKTDAEQGNTANKIADPENFITNNPDTKIYIRFVNKYGCSEMGGLTLGGGFGGNGGAGNFGICHSKGTTEKEIILSVYDQSLIEGYNSKEYMTVTYYETQVDADSRTNAIESITLTADKTIYARISLNNHKANTNGVNTQSPIVEVSYKVVEVHLEFKESSSSVNAVSKEICDKLYDGKEKDFDLTQFKDEITTDTAAILTYFDEGVKILDPEKYLLQISPSQEKEITVKVKLSDGCVLETTITLKFYPKIQTKKNQTFPKCDVDGNGEENFNLTEILPILIDSNTSNYEITSYHETEYDAKAEPVLNPITTINNYLVTTSKTIYVKIKDKTTGCSIIEKIKLKVIPVPTIKEDKLLLCDYKNDNEEKDVTLSQFNYTIIGNQSSVTASYFATKNDAENSTSSLTKIDIITSKSLFVKLSAPGNCDKIAPIEITLQKSPEVKDIEVTICDNLEKGTESYDLRQKQGDIVSNPNNHTFRYFSSEQNAINNTGAISYNPKLNTVPQTIYVRTTNTTTRCFSISKIKLDFILPVEVENTELSSCDNDGNLSEEFDLEKAIPQMLSKLSNQNKADLKPTYYSNEKAAKEANSAFIITNFKNYNTASADDTIYVRFDNQKTGCFSIGKIELKVLKTPKLVSGTHKICDTDLDGVYTADLSNLNDIVIKVKPDLTFAYYTSRDDAEKELNKITNTTNYVIPQNNYDIYVRVENTSGCRSIIPVEVKFNTSVSVNSITDVLESCDDDLDGFANFNLTPLEPKLTSESNATFRYYANENDAKKQQSEIATPASYTNTTAKEQTIYVRVSVPEKCDAITSFKIKTINIKNPNLKDVSICKGNSVILDAGSQYTSYLWSTSETTQSIEVSKAGVYTVTLTDSKGCQGTYKVKVTELELPTVNSHTIKECYTSEFKTLKLTDYNTLLTNNTSNTVEFYLSENDRNAGVNKLSPSFTNTTSPQTIYVKVKNTLGCYATTTLTINFIKIPNAPKAISSLSYEYDENAEILTAEVDSGNVLMWYTEEVGGLELGSTPIPSTTAVGSTDYWVSQINSFGCVSKRTKVTVNVAKALISVYNEFSPNGDRYNEYFKIKHIEMYPNNKVEIFNRFGNLVFTMKGYTNNSDKSFRGISNVGGFLGDKLVIGVYFYLIDLGNGSKAKKGWVNINR